MSIDQKVKELRGKFNGYVHDKVKPYSEVLADALTTQIKPRNALAAGALAFAIACGGSGGGGGGNDGGNNDPPKPDEPGDFHYKTLNSIKDFYTQSVNGINSPLTYGPDVNTSYSCALTKAQFAAAYKDNEEFRTLFNNMYGAIVQKRRTGLTPEEANKEVKNLVDSLTDGKDLELDAEGMPNEGSPVVFFGYVPDGAGGQKAYLAYWVKDEEGNHLVLGAVDYDTVKSGITTLVNVEPVVEERINDSNEGF